MSKCKACEATILFVKFPSGKSNPIDPTPTPNGNIIMAEGDDYDARVLKRDEAIIARENQIPLYESHFSSCPMADKFRK